MYNKILLKLSGEAFMGDGEEKSSVLSKKVLLQLANQIKHLVNENKEIGIVIGGGNLFRGRYAEDFSIDKVPADHMGMIATVFNSLAFKAVLDELKVESVVMSAINIDKVCEPFSNSLALSYLKKKKVVIFAGGTGNPYFSTDTAAALRASEMKMDIILMAKNGTEGIYNKDPNKFDDAKMYEEITYDEILDKQLKVIDLSAITLAKENKIEMIVFNIEQNNAIINIVKGQKIGTFVGE